MADQPDLAERAVSISGLHDLWPLLHTKMNDILCLTPDMAHGRRAALQFRSAPARILQSGLAGMNALNFWRQSALMREAWPGIAAWWWMAISTILT